MGKIRKKIVSDTTSRKLFPKKPTIGFYPETEVCPHCGRKPTVRKTQKRTISTLDIGTFEAKATILECRNDKAVFTAGQLQSMTPPGCNFGYDVIVHVGLSIFVYYRGNKEIMRDLASRNIGISDSEISYLGRKFIIYLAIAHDETRDRLRGSMAKKGGYILHIDGTFEGDSPHLFCGLDGISELVLDAIKIPSEKKEYIAPFLKSIKEQYGNPIALVHDMGTGIMGAVAEVFPGLPDYICHFHFLRDIGKDMLSDDHRRIMKILKKHKIRRSLRQKVRYLGNKISGKTELINEFLSGIKAGRFETDSMALVPTIAAYALIHWVFEAPSQSKGYGFPFDTPHLEFYRRLKKVQRELDKITNRSDVKDKKPLTKVRMLLEAVIRDKQLKATAASMEAKTEVFDKLRTSLRIASPQGENGLNDEGESDIETIENKVKDFRQWLEKDKARRATYSGMIKQIDKYWDKLFADPIVVNTNEGQFTVVPQRTNNILERFFRNEKRRDRKKRGCVSLNKTLKAILAKTPLVRNLEKEEYLEDLLDGCSSLAERFSKIDARLVRGQLDMAKKDRNKIPPEVKKVICKPDFPQKVAAALVG